MEAFPRTEMMAPELKDPEHPFPMSQCDKIKNVSSAKLNAVTMLIVNFQYIAAHYQNNPNNFNAAFVELDDMRNVVL